jgi:hypothetical protein
MTTTTRRAILAGLAATPVVALPAIADALPGADPIFAAIEAHKTAFARFGDVCELTDKVLAKKEERIITDEDESRYAEANDAERAALDELLSTIPQTTAGARAALEWLVEYDAGCVPDASGRFVETLLRSPVFVEARS